MDDFFDPEEIERLLGGESVNHEKNDPLSQEEVERLLSGITPDTKGNFSGVIKLVEKS